MNKKLEENALEILKLDIKNKNFDSVYYLEKLFILSKVENNLKDYIKLIKKSLKFLSKRFDETYLLLFSLKDNSIFIEKENRVFLNFVDDLLGILNKEDYTKEYDNLNQLKSKIELGYNRYFIQGKRVVSVFNKSSFNFELVGEDKINFENILRELYEKKYRKSKDYKKELKKYENYFKYFPMKIYDNKMRYLFEIKKSLFLQEKLNVKELKKEKIILEEINNSIIAGQILRLLE